MLPALASCAQLPLLSSLPRIRHSSAISSHGSLGFQPHCSCVACIERCSHRPQRHLFGSSAIHYTKYSSTPEYGVQIPGVVFSFRRLRCRWVYRWTRKYKIKVVYIWRFKIVRRSVVVFRRSAINFGKCAQQPLLSPRRVVNVKVTLFDD